MDTNHSHKPETKTVASEKPRTPLVAFLMFMLFFVPFCLLMVLWAGGDTGGVHEITGWRVVGPLIAPLPTLAFFTGLGSWFLLLDFIRCVRYSRKHKGEHKQP